jgi:type VII secretion protein EccB
MATRRDQLQSYQFLTQRVISAFVMRETDPAQSPLRRGIGAVFGGIMVAVIVGAVFGVYGLLTKIGSNTWKTDGAVVVEKETGASFVYQNGVLHPTLNYASALLASGHPGVVAARIAAASLAGVARGVTIGIPNAPNSLPTAANRIGEPWTMCSLADTDNSGNATTTVTLAVGRGPTGARQIVGDQGLLVRNSATGNSYLTWRSHRYLIRQPKIVVPALFGATTNAVPVGTAWLNGLPAGGDIGPITVTERGAPSATVPGRIVGDVLMAQTGAAPSYFLVLGDGLAPITELQKDILAAQFPVTPIPTTLSAATSSKRSNAVSQPSGDAAPPQSPPQLVQPAASDVLCAQSVDARSAPTLFTGGTVDQLDAANPTGSSSTAGASLADRVLVPAGRIAIVRTVSGPGASGGAYYLVTDLGIRYAVPSEAVLTLLGYDAKQAVDVPSSLVTRIPAGPTLDPAAATQPAHLTGSN